MPAASCSTASIWSTPTPPTVEIAQRTLSAICHATGLMQVDDSEQLHLIPLIADVKVQPPKNGYDASNTLRYLSVDSERLHPAAPFTKSSHGTYPLQVVPSACPVTPIGEPGTRQRPLADRVHSLGRGPAISQVTPLFLG